MTAADKVIEDFVLKHAYDPVYAREYYLRTRKLKGENKASGKEHPQSKVSYSGKPVVVKPGKRIEEDETPNASPNGAKLVNYDGSGLGTATYEDGSVFTSSGWKLGDKGWSDKAREAALKARLENAKKNAEKVGGEKGKSLLGKLDALQNKLAGKLDVVNDATLGALIPSLSRTPEQKREFNLNVSSIRRSSRSMKAWSLNSKKERLDKRWSEVQTIKDPAKKKAANTALRKEVAALNKELADFKKKI